MLEQPKPQPPSVLRRVYARPVLSHSSLVVIILISTSSMLSSSPSGHNCQDNIGEIWLQWEDDDIWPVQRAIVPTLLKPSANIGLHTYSDLVEIDFPPLAILGTAHFDLYARTGLLPEDWRHKTVDQWGCTWSWESRNPGFGLPTHSNTCVEVKSKSITFMLTGETRRESEKE